LQLTSTTSSHLLLSASVASTSTAPPPEASSSIHVKPYDEASDAPPTRAQLAEMKSDDEDDGLFDELEQGLDDDFDLGGFRERRMEELRAQSVLLALYSRSGAS
jgi:hypothetical protein